MPLFKNKTKKMEEREGGRVGEAERQGKRRRRGLTRHTLYLVLRKKISRDLVLFFSEREI